MTFSIETLPQLTISSRVGGSCSLSSQALFSFPGYLLRTGKELQSLGGFFRFLVFVPCNRQLVHQVLYSVSSLKA